MHPAFCQIESSKPRLGFILKALLQNRTRVLTNSFVNIFKRGTLGAAAILHRSANNPACIGDEIRYDQHTSQRPTCPLQGNQRADVEPRWVNKKKYPPCFLHFPLRWVPSFVESDLT